MSLSTKVIFLLLFSITSTLKAQEEPSILVYGSASIFVAPDEIIIQISSEHVDNDLQVAKSKTEAQIKVVTDLLKSYNVKSKHIQTKELTNGRFYNNKIRQYSGYVSKHALMFCLRDMEDFDVIFDQLLQMDLEKVGSPQLVASNAKTIKNDAYIAAIQDAKSKADLFAITSGQKVGKVIMIKELINNNTRNSGAYSNGQDLGSSLATELFAPGQLEIKAMVEISYQLL